MTTKETKRKGTLAEMPRARGLRLLLDALALLASPLPIHISSSRNQRERERERTMKCGQQDEEVGGRYQGKRGCALIDLASLMSLLHSALAHLFVTINIYTHNINIRNLASNNEITKRSIYASATFTRRLSCANSKTQC